MKRCDFFDKAVGACGHVVPHAESKLWMIGVAVVITAMVALWYKVLNLPDEKKPWEDFHFDD